MADTIQFLRPAPVQFDHGVAPDGSPFPVGYPTPVNMAPGWCQFVRYALANRSASHASVNLEAQGNGHVIHGLFLQTWRMGSNGAPEAIRDLGWIPSPHVHARIARGHGLAVYVLIEGVRGAGAPILAEAQGDPLPGYHIAICQIAGAAGGPAGPAVPAPHPGPAAAPAVPGGAAVAPIPGPAAPPAPAGGLFPSP